jgi:UDP-N-acetylglucosamine--N-acetylmuramyl-(pentapeptide) pyrophosphoryl-undecaprenol N-acetylglucosamine transferase
MISTLDRAALREQALTTFGLRADLPTLLVTGGSQGAARINAALAAAAPDLAETGIGVLHAYGRKNEFEVPPSVVGTGLYAALPYLDRMDLAYAAADLVLARSGAMTVAEIAAVGLPAVYVPLPHGNGEQRLNAAAQVASGAAIIIDDADLSRETVLDKVLPLVIDGIMRDGMTASAAATAAQPADEIVAAMVLDAVAGRPR